MKKMKSLAALAAAGIVGISAFAATPVFAEASPVEGNEVAVTKTLTLTDGVKPADGLSFDFTVANGAGVTPSASADPDTIFAGVTGGLTATAATQTAGDTSKTSYTGGLTANAAVFKYPGIYRYTVTEAPVSADKAYEGITITDNPTYTVDVYVVYDANNTLTVNYMEIHKDDSTTKTNEIAFGNTYDPAALTITKQITGNQSVASDEFGVTVTINGAAGEEYEVATSDNQPSQTLTAKDGGVATTELTVTNGTTITIKGLSTTDTYQITETALKGYTPSINGAQANDGQFAAEAMGSLTDKNVTLVNTKEGTVPTGIIMSAAPYAAMIGLGGVFAGFFFRKKKED